MSESIAPIRNLIVRTEIVDAADLTPNELNWRTHPESQRRAMEEALDTIGWAQAVIVNQRTGRIVDGHLRRDIAHERGESIPVIYIDADEQTEARILASFDPISRLAGQDDDLLAALADIAEIETQYLGAMLDNLMSSDLETATGEADAEVTAAARATLSDRFLVPPFSVLDARQGYWQDRKRSWVALGIRSELGRGESASIGGSPLPIDREQANTRAINGHSPSGERNYNTALLNSGSVNRKGSTRAINDHKWQAEKLDRPQAVVTDSEASGTSIFDPVICEIAYRWFCPPGGVVLDPFAGGSVRGIVAAHLGRSYIGIDLSAPQVAANQVQAEAIGPDPMPIWHIGDAADLDTILADDFSCDFVFTCPPYHDLEVYSDDPRDLSMMDYPAFLASYRDIIARSIARLRPDRFAMIVVGDIRDTKGVYRNFVSDTIAAFHDAGARLYNEAILVTAVGSLPIRVGRQFEAGRKLGKTHQNVLMFVKGDPRRATAALGPVDVTDSLLDHVADTDE